LEEGLNRNLLDGAIEVIEEEICQQCSQRAYEEHDVVTQMGRWGIDDNPVRSKRDMAVQQCGAISFMLSGIASRWAPVKPTLKARRGRQRANYGQDTMSARFIVHEKWRKQSASG
jgi:hypothetical protein